MTPAPWPAPATAQPGHRSALVLATLAALLAVGALVVAVLALNKSTGTATYTTEQKSAAKNQLCERYKLAAHAMHIETSTPDNATFARISATNGALIIDVAAADPALDARYRDAAHNLTISYLDLTALGTAGMSDATSYQQAVDTLNARDHVMQELCGE
ncbi:hypothetical protein [Mycolicibacter sinensis]|uniref:hypothetical protein n=1 Tax=Mycolicibacter sinensis (strain JDM601) TaxID=875328 RepID=UPI0009DA1FDE|nr:hypothetical protein [Mycolicibacter sinensis]